MRNLVTIISSALVAALALVACGGGADKSVSNEQQGAGMSASSEPRAKRLGVQDISDSSTYNFFPGSPTAFNSASGSIVAGYIPADRLSAGYNLSQVPAKNLTHLIYAFLSICDSQNPFQPSNAEVQAVAAVCTGANKADFELAVTGSTVDSGHYTTLSNYKQSAPGLKLLFSVGGGSPATVPFYRLSKTAAARAIFINSVISYMSAHPAYDGVDVDWESPTAFQGDTSALGPNPPTLGTPADSQNFVALMAEMRTALNNLGASTGRTYLLTSAMSTDANLVAAIDYQSAQNSMDYIFAMTYDYFGWGATGGNHAALYNADPLYGIKSLINAGVPARKVVLGVGMYSRYWSGATITSTAPARVNGTPAGWHTYSAVAQNYLDVNGAGKNGYTSAFDPVEHAYYLWSSATSTYIGYDDPRAVAEKGRYAVNRGLGGVFAWELGQDNGHILSAMNYGVRTNTNWTLCGGEGATCTFTGTMAVRYGANGTYFYKTATDSTACSNASFGGDPIANTVKHCDYAPPPPATDWTPCAAENGTCSFSGMMVVRYGANGSYSYQQAVGSTSCSNASFGGDPIANTVKHCAYSAQAPLNGWTLCASESGTCTFQGNADVAYGANGAFFYRSATNSISCTNAVFGDPISNTAKSCYYRVQSFDWCANESGNCAFVGTMVVRYGANNSYLYRTATGGSACDNATFGGDPIPGTAKRCDDSPLPPNTGWTQCASEGNTCSFSGTRNVAYGANGSFFFRTATGSSACNNATFGGDPLPNVAKVCYYK